MFRDLILRSFNFLILAVVLSSKCFGVFENLENVLLIINYNFAHYESMPLLKKIYEPYFKNIVFYGPEKYPGIHLFKHHDGYLSYLCMADAMRRYPDHDGYLFLMDDCILNAWLLDHMDTSKIWFPLIPAMKSNKGNPLDVNQRWLTKTFWWRTKWGCKAVRRTLKNIPNRYINTLTRNWGQSNVVGAYSDIIYIPSIYRDQYIELARIFGEHRVFLEIALPTIVSCLNPKDEWIYLKGHGVDRRKCIQDFQLDVYFNHPLKLSYSENRSFILRTFEQVKNQLKG